MSNKEWKEGFEAGIDFALTFVNEQCDLKFEGLGEMVAELQYLQKIKRIVEDHLSSKEQS